MADEIDPVTVSYQPVWNGLGNLPISPVLLEVNNVGKPEVVQIKWGSGLTEVSTFFDMPTGATKQRVVYLEANQYYGAPEIRVKRGFIDMPISIELGSNASYDAIKIGIVSDVAGLGGAFVRDRSTPRKGGVDMKFATGVAKPGESPGRTVGYRGIQALFLAEGSERLTDAEVNAIKGAVLQGLNLIFVGGTISPVINDRRWSELLPVVPSGVIQQVAAPKQFSEFGPSVGAVPMLIALPKSDARLVKSGSVVVEAKRQLGLGSVTFLAFDPFQTKWKQWPGRFNWLQSRAFGANTTPSDLTGLSDLSRIGQDSGAESEPDVSVFGIQMPSAGRISAVLIGYLILVVPVNFLILRRLKRGELAWITGPLIALGCAGVLFAFAGQLYEAKASRFAQGYLLAGDGVEDGIFVGRQQIFFPGTGQYDLGLKGVESAGSGTAQYDRGAFGQMQVQNEFVDMGEVVSPRYTVSNLSFRQMSLTQRVALPNGWVQSERGENGKIVRGAIANPFPSELLNVIIVAGAKKLNIGAVGVGAQKSFELKGVDPTAEIWVQAKTSGAMFGSQYGSAVGKDSVKVHYQILENR
ncbi:MAG: hypothetical protein ACKVQS_12775 [Fimbriimonadaceae bacterium]